ncbi:N-acylneuraminate cytidylyltransferase [Microbacterium oxydans]|uniref:N-acylneuraminate cytidylyltransferase n=1 Tax=Microbacterium oxydans TaxID=82380 RepID=A0A0F0L9N7_9MICO|nr:acylneuraminate cytidylyltransferase [Microbacterium oxydans]KJL29848.1 N-acylneuraminate cytidylyltransferase [Microbacterium oxydans]CAH0149842.1 N-acylneuraminate cytidylyltransferase [Microbacterium oxydans]
MTDTTTVTAVAIIPARGGSKGVPRKNLQPVGGVPLVQRAIHAAQAAEGIDLVVVSTDDAEIAAVSEAAGARVVHRPAELSGDTASSESAILHALDHLELEGVTPQIVAFLQATSPFIPSAALATAVSDIRAGRADSVFSAFETYGFLWRRGADGEGIAINHDASFRPRRQDREPHHLESGAFYVFRTEGFRESRHRFFGRIRIAEVPEWTAIEIDDEQQLGIARALAARQEQPHPIPANAVVTDFDGVHTDDTAIVDADGREQVRVSREDGMGVAMLRRAGVPMLILSTEVNPVVRARAEKLRVPVLHGIDDKESALRAWAETTGVALDDIAYLGNDVNDLPAMRIVGWPVAVANAHPKVLEQARVILSRSGGDGAVRELIERVLSS